MKHFWVCAGKVFLGVLSAFALWGFTLLLYYTCPQEFATVFPAVAVWAVSFFGLIAGNLALWGML